MGPFHGPDLKIWYLDSKRECLKRQDIEAAGF